VGFSTFGEEEGFIQASGVETGGKETTWYRIIRIWDGGVGGQGLDQSGSG